MNVYTHLDELDSSAETQALRDLTTRMLQGAEIEPSPDLLPRVMAQLDNNRRCARARAFAPAFKRWIGVAAAAVVMVFMLRFLCSGSRGCSLSNELWLVSSQGEDGSWNPARYGGEQCYQPALTALAAWALHCSGERRFSAAVERACHYLSSVQQADGSFGGVERERLYNQAIVTYVLAEIGRDDPNSAALLQAAVACIHSSQSVAGGWDYVADSEGNAAVTAWQVQALLSAKKSGVVAADLPLRKGLRWLRGLAHPDGAVAYSKRAEQSSETINALTGYALITAGRDYPELADIGRQVVTAMSQVHSVGATSDLYRDCMKVRAYKAAGSDASARALRARMGARIIDPAEDQWGMVGGRLYLSAMQSLARSY
ncbi:MAG: prenyltransferase/squalene oxidase repeat-containing protein [Kiritimatiellae bacterium]|nr:prenyltransferase/squalene oxidase repeat-containing protein [Kiritimatiellia bacterium]